MQNKVLTDAEAESFILRSSLYKGIIATRQLRDVVDQWHTPDYEDFKPRTAWSLMNAFTHVLGELQTKNPNELSVRTMRLQSLLAKEAQLEIAA